MKQRSLQLAILAGICFTVGRYWPIFLDNQDSRENGYILSVDSEQIGSKTRNEKTAKSAEDAFHTVELEIVEIRREMARVRSDLALLRNRFEAAGAGLPEVSASPSQTFTKEQRISFDEAQEVQIRRGMEALAEYARSLEDRFHSEPTSPDWAKTTQASIESAWSAAGSDRSDLLALECRRCADSRSCGIRSPPRFPMYRCRRGLELPRYRTW